MELDERTLLSVRQSAARDAIREIVALYCRAVDRCDRELLRGCYWPEATEERGFFSGDRDAFVAWVMPQLQMLEGTHHQTGNPSIALRGDRADVETYWIGYKKPQAGPNVRDQITGGRYLDEMEERDGEWRILRRVAVADWLTTAESLPWASFPLGALIKGERGPSDRVYAFPTARTPTA